MKNRHFWKSTSSFLWSRIYAQHLPADSCHTFLRSPNHYNSCISAEVVVHYLLFIFHLHKNLLQNQFMQRILHWNRKSSEMARRNSGVWICVYMVLAATLRANFTWEYTAPEFYDTPLFFHRTHRWPIFDLSCRCLLWTLGEWWNGLGIVGLIEVP